MSQHTKLSLVKKILLPLLPDSNSQPFDHESGALTNKLSCVYHVYNVCGKCSKIRSKPPPPPPHPSHTNTWKDHPSFTTDVN